MSGLRGVVEYEPNEFVFTALAGTPVAEVVAMLAEHGQYLPFDPPFVAAGATLGGAVASGLSGPGRYRYGGVRDFVIGVRFVDGLGQLVRGGGKVVKNAAGFDLPKLMVGSLGRLGALVELSFKVFPKPPAFGTLRVDYPSLAAAVEAMATLVTKPLDIEAVDLEPSSASASLLVRIGGREDQLESADATSPRAARRRRDAARRCGAVVLAGHRRVPMGCQERNAGEDALNCGANRCIRPEAGGFGCAAALQRCRQRGLGRPAKGWPSGAVG